MSLRIAAGAGGFITLAGTTYVARPLRLIDLGDLRLWLAAQVPDPLDVAAEAIRKLDFLREKDSALFAQLARDIIDAASSDKRAQATDRDIISAAMQSAEGIARFVWLSVRQEQPNVSLEKIIADLSDVDLPRITRQLDVINGVRESDEWDEEIDGPKAKKASPEPEAGTPSSPASSSPAAPPPTPTTSPA